MKTKEELFKDYGINSETQPQFINIVQGGKNVVINVSDISKVEPVNENKESRISLRSGAHLRVACTIDRLVRLLPNVMLLDLD